MANNIILVHQRIDFVLLQNQFPKTPPAPRRKLFFQCELRSLANGDATFGLICYPAWRTGLGVPWTIGEPVRGVDDNSVPPETFPLTPFVAFGNNEIILAPRGAQMKGYEKSAKQNPDFTELRLKIEKDADEALLKKSVLRFKPAISENPHAEYTVTLEFGGLSSTEEANPRPPYPPEE